MPWLEDEAAKRRVVRDILEGLPDWFGIAESIDTYVRESAALPCYTHEEDGSAVGFVCLKRTSECAMEVHVMGIAQARHRGGIGRGLIEAAQAYALGEGCSVLHVKTVAPSAGYASYLKTYAFYRAMGFLPLEVLDLWDEHNPCQLLVKWIA